MYEYFDTHTHLDVSDFDSDREDVIEKMREQKISAITIGVDFNSSERAVDLSSKYENIFASIGQHPEDLNTETVFDERLVSLIDNKKVVAIGECGLDYYWLDKNDNSPINREYLVSLQKKVFENHVDLSISAGKPLMLHIRSTKGTQDAYLDTLDILEHHAKLSGNKLKGNAHFFAGDLDVLRRFLDIGFSVSFTGVITFSRDYDEYVRYVPDDMILPETDAPFVAPVPFRGQRNSPLYIGEIVKKIAEIRGEPFDKMKEILVKNTIKHFSGIGAVAS